ncbi:MAG: DUF3662 domain-containing protein [Dehalococcoidia bacterium]|nr:DUF3662 domain-containing protein [Dehalococcoidia bacterium]
MTDQPRIERFLEQAARMASGAGIHPVEVLQRIQAAAEASIRDGAIANAYRVQYAPADVDRIARLRDQLARGAGRMLDELANGRGLRQLGPWQFEFVEGPLSRPAPSASRPPTESPLTALRPPPPEQPASSPASAESGSSSSTGHVCRSPTPPSSSGAVSVATSSSRT